MDNRQLSRHAGMYSCLVALMTHVCRDAEQQSDSGQFASFKFWTSVCAEITRTGGTAPADAFIFTNTPVRQKTLIGNAAWNGRTVGILPYSLRLRFIFQDTKSKALNNLLSCFYAAAFSTRQFVCSPQSNYEWCISSAHLWPMQLWWERRISCHDTVQHFSIITNLSLFPQVLACISQFSFMVLCKTGSCFMVQQREIVWCTVNGLSRPDSKLENYWILHSKQFTFEPVRRK